MKWGLIGAGRIGAMHAANIAAHYRPGALYDPDSETAKKVAAQYGFSFADSAAEIFNDDATDAVFIASATATHCEYLTAAARAKKPALCEKPLDLDIARVEECAASLGDSPPPIQIGFNRRFDPGHADLIRRVRDGEIGAPEKIVITSRDPGMPGGDYIANSGGLFRDMMIHDFDIARAILPDEPVRIFATGAAFVDPKVCADANDVDTAMAILQTASGALCHINCSRRAVYGYDQRVEVFGAGGMLISGNRRATETEFYGAQTTAARAPLLHFFVERYADSYRIQLQTFVESLQKSIAPSPSFEDGRRALLIANAAAKSLHSGKWEEINFGKPSGVASDAKE